MYSILTEFGPNCDVKSSNGSIPRRSNLSTKVGKRFLACARDDTGLTALHLATALGHASVVQVLLEDAEVAEACLVATDAGGATALHRALERGRNWGALIWDPVQREQQVALTSC